MGSGSFADHLGRPLMQFYSISFVEEIGRLFKKDIPAMGLGQVPFTYCKDKGWIYSLNNIIDLISCFKRNILKKRLTAFHVQQEPSYLSFSGRPGKVYDIAFCCGVGTSFFIE